MKRKAFYTTNTGQEVYWEPPNESAAHQALAAVAGTGVSTATEAQENAAVDLGDDIDLFREVRADYQDRVAWDIAISLDDGQVQAGGSDAEPVSVSVTDQDGNLVSGDHVVELDVDGDQVQVQTLDGQGVYDVTTTKPAGSAVTVQAVNVADHASNASAEQTIDVV